MPDIKFAAADVASMKLGTTNVVKVMQGTVEIWPGGPTIPTTPVSTGLRWWLDADDASTFTFSSGVFVTQWRDKSGNNFHMGLGGISTNVTRNGSQNGRTTVVHVTNNWLKTSTPVSTAIDDITWLVACKRTAGDNSQSVAVHNGDWTATTGYGLALRAGGSTIGLLRANLEMHSTATADPATGGVYTLQRASGTWSLRLNGTATNLASTGTVSTPAVETVLSSPSHPWGGEIYEVLQYDRVLTTGERADNEAYLKNKWGTP